MSAWTLASSILNDTCNPPRITAALEYTLKNIGTSFGTPIEMEIEAEPCKKEKHGRDRQRFERRIKKSVPDRDQFQRSRDAVEERHAVKHDPGANASEKEVFNGRFLGPGVVFQEPHKKVRDQRDEFDREEDHQQVIGRNCQ